LLDKLLGIGAGGATGDPWSGLRTTSSGAARLSSAIGKTANGNSREASAGRSDRPLVEVHNYSSAKVRTEERSDGHGGRQPVLIMEDQMAASLARPGSAPNKVMHGAYGVQQRLIKR